MWKQHSLQLLVLKFTVFNHATCSGSSHKIYYLLLHSHRCLSNIWYGLTPHYYFYFYIMKSLSWPAFCSFSVPDAWNDFQDETALFSNVFFTVMITICQCYRYFVLIKNFSDFGLSDRSGTSGEKIMSPVSTIKSGLAVRIVYGCSQ